MDKPKIIVIDDELDLVKLTGKRLKAAGYNIFYHHDGRGAIDAIKEALPDIILLDIKLPHISGIEIFKILREDPALKTIPVIFFSASASDIDLCIEGLGANGFIKKPYKPEELIDALNRAMVSHLET